MTSRLTQLENVIASNQRKFYQIGKALKQIRNDRLFRDVLFDGFDAYVKERWDMAKSQAYRLIEAATVIDNLSPIGDGILPENESQARILARYKEDDQRKIWREFIASGMALTAANIQKSARLGIQKKSVKKAKTTAVDIISADFKAAVLNILEQIRLARNDGWQATTKEAALFWLKVMKETILRHEKP